MTPAPSPPAPPPGARFTAATRTARLVPALVAGTLLVGCAGGPEPAGGPRGDAAPPPSVADAVEGVRRAEGIGEMGTSLGWDGFAVGMERRQAERRHGAALDLRPVEDACGDAGARVERDGVELFLGFTGDSAAALLHTLVVRLPPDATRDGVVADLRNRLATLRYRPSRHWPDMPEEENPKPLYVVPEIPEVGILVGVREGWLWISFLDCMD